MNLRQRYRRLTFWNKVAFWGSSASIMALLLALGWRFSDSRSVARANQTLERLVPTDEVLHAVAVERLNAARVRLSVRRGGAGIKADLSQLTASWAEAAVWLRDVQALREITFSSYEYGTGAQLVITDVQPLGDLSSLWVLDLSGTQISEIQPLANMSELRSLNLFNKKVHDLSPLSELRQLQVLVLGETNIEDLTPLQGLPRLNVLDLRSICLIDPCRETRVRDIDIQAFAAARGDVELLHD